jgi:hypothetical protein
VLRKKIRDKETFACSHEYMPQYFRSRKPSTISEFVGRYPRVLARIAAAGRLSSIEQAAVILRDATARRKNYSDWVLSNHQGDALQAVQYALRTTH